MRNEIACLVLAVVILAYGPPPAHAQEVSGQWDVRWAQAVRVNADGSVEVQALGDAQLVLLQDGERVTGTWTTQVLETVTWTVSGTLIEGQLSLEGTEHDSDNPELAVVDRLVWKGSVSPGRIEGTVEMWFEGMNRAPGARPFTATASSLSGSSPTRGR